MKDDDDIQAIFAAFDMRAETLTATLLAQAEGMTEGFDLERTVVAPLGSNGRRAGKDVAEIRKKYYDHEDVLYIEVNRKGLYDTLPKHLFLRTENDYESAIERTKAFTRQIKEARKFFLPYEQAMFHPRVEAERKEQKYTERFPDFISNLWGLDKFRDCLDERQVFLLCCLLPAAQRIVGNWDLTGLCLEAVLQKPVDLNFAAPAVPKIPDSGQRNESLQLGVDAIIGEEFRDDMPVLEVSVKGITDADLFDYLPGGKRLILLEELLYSYFIPLEMPVITKIIVTDDTLNFILDKAVLGYNVQFNKT